MRSAEELVSDWKCPHCGSTTGTWFSRVEPMGDFCEDCGKAVDEEPAPEWRELAPDEVICEGDDVMDLQGNWQKAEISIGSTPRNRCTKARRPLPQKKG